MPEKSAIEKKNGWSILKAFFEQNEEPFIFLSTEHGSVQVKRQE